MLTDGVVTWRLLLPDRRDPLPTFAWLEAKTKPVRMIYQKIYHKMRPLLSCRGVLRLAGIVLYQICDIPIKHWSYQPFTEGKKKKTVGWPQRASLTLVFWQWWFWGWNWLWKCLPSLRYKRATWHPCLSRPKLTCCTYIHLNRSFVCSLWAATCWNCAQGNTRSPLGRM